MTTVLTCPLAHSESSDPTSGALGHRRLPSRKASDFDRDFDATLQSFIKVWIAERLERKAS